MFKAIFFNLTDLELRRKLRVQEVSESVADPEHLARSFCDIGTGILLPVHLKSTSVLNYFSRDSFPLNKIQFIKQNWIRTNYFAMPIFSVNNSYF